MIFLDDDMDTINLPDQKILCKEYDELLPVRTGIARELELCVEEAVSPLFSHPRIKGRVKSFRSYFRKYIRFLKGGVPESPAGNHPHNSLACSQDIRARIIAASGITDFIGIRIICPFLEDLGTVEKLMREKFSVLEVERKGEFKSFREFGYESVHLLIEIPDEILKGRKIPYCDIAEIQIRTILQDAWAEVEHELIYKAEFSPFDNPLKRKLAAVNASLSLADTIFQEIRNYQRELNGELEKRRGSFFRKIEESTDAILYAEENNPGDEGLEDEPHIFPPFVSSSATESIDELLLSALYAHNKNQFSKAISIYTRILEMDPDNTVKALIYKHRGMACFARSHYEQAISDFSHALILDPKSYKMAYYQGIVCSVLKQYPQALDAFNKSLEINPYQAYCLYRRAQTYYHLEDYPQALGDCEAALGLESFDAARKFRDLLLRKLKM